MSYQLTFQKLEPKADQPQQHQNDVLLVKMENAAAGLKKCFKCGEAKTTNDFYKHSAMADGLLGKCKDCTKKDAANRIERVKNDVNWVEKERERCRNKQVIYRKTHVVKTYPEVKERWADKNKIKRKAQFAANNALRDGKIKRSEICEICGAKGELEKHHPDYEKPLLIQWLCLKCHGLTRRKNKYVPIGRNP
ncbi:MAG: hypothetical protein KGJ13_09615 [Patescibacteria group bacterium]|nr:hypothetical protein [Patescibacteria group bacterium]